MRLGLLFSLLVMATGMIWGKAAWGAWWDWEPRLTTFLIVCFLYAAYFVLRQTVEEENRRAAFAAVAAGVALLSGGLLYGRLRLTKKGFGVGSLLFGGVLYAAFLGVTLWSIL